MDQYSEAEHAAEMREMERARQEEIRDMRAEAIAASEHGWRSFLLGVADAIAAGVVLGIGASVGAMGCLLLAVGAVPRSDGALLVLGGVPLLSLAAVFLVLSVGPLDVHTVRHPRIVANSLLVAWIIATWLFFLIMLNVLS